MVLLRGLSVLTEFFTRPKLQVKVTVNLITQEAQPPEKEFLLLVANTGKSTAQNCRVKLMFRKPMLHVPYLDWFEPTMMPPGTSADVQYKLGKAVDLFPDPNRPLLAGWIQISKEPDGTRSSIKTYEMKDGEVVRLGYLLEIGKVYEVDAVFTWERERLETHSEHYILNLKSFEDASMTPAKS